MYFYLFQLCLSPGPKECELLPQKSHAEPADMVQLSHKDIKCSIKVSRINAPKRTQHQNAIRQAAFKDTNGKKETVVIL